MQIRYKAGKRRAGRFVQRPILRPARLPQAVPTTRPIHVVDSVASSEQEISASLISNLPLVKSRLIVEIFGSVVSTQIKPVCLGPFMRIKALKRMLLIKESQGPFSILSKNMYCW
jgi:hypothetical protein